jgi:quercetin dioxygenase-like cupin family protein
MGSIFRTASIFVVGIVVGSVAVSTLRAQTYRTVKSTKLMTTDLTGWCDGKVVVVEVSDFSAGSSAKHYHPGHSFGYVLEGSQTAHVDGKPPIVSRVGDVYYEAPMQAATSESPAPLKMITFRILEKGKPETVNVP